MLSLTQRLGLSIVALATAPAAFAQPDVVQSIAADVYFHEGEQKLGHCNNGWIVFDEYVLGVDANYPSGAKIILPKIRATTAKPIRFVVDTHFHPDHSFGNQLWANDGAVVVAQIATLDELKKSGAEAWAREAKNRPDVAASQLKLPDLTFTDALTFADAHHRVELHWFGVAHTRGDTLVWLPREKILFTGDLCVNGPFNYLHDCNLAGWIKVLEMARQLGAAKVCPGHGPIGGAEIIVDQQNYFIALQRGVRALAEAKSTPAEIRSAVPGLGAALRKNLAIARYVPTDFWLAAQVEKVVEEMRGAPWPP